MNNVIYVNEEGINLYHDGLFYSCNNHQFLELVVNITGSFFIFLFPSSCNYDIFISRYNKFI